MCRISGILNQQKPVCKDTLLSARDSLSYGGPDAADIYVGNESHLGLGHRRLSIIDLSESGTQPFYWNNLIISYNGEVYNFEQVKSKMPEYRFTTGTDTEVILKAYHKWGKDCVQHFRGMFAFSIWDEREQKLLLCRDRVGVKPLYWYWKDSLFLFASELKAFHHHPDFDKTIDPQAVSLFLQQGYIHAPFSIFKYVHKLEPGYFLEIEKGLTPKKYKYYDVKKNYREQALDQRDENEIAEELESLLSKSFRLRMVADVPVGMFLSGGIDSSLVTALLQKHYNRPLKTFTIGFEDPERDEAPFAKKVAQHLGTDHTELYCTEKEITDIIPSLPDIYDEPFGDASGIPTYLVSKLAREQVKVSLSADGGDELFGGYTKYEFTQNYFGKIQKIPSLVRQGLSKVLRQIDPDWLEDHRQYFPILRNYNNLTNKFSKVQNAFEAPDLLSFFNTASSYLNQQQVKSFLPEYYSRYPKNGVIPQNDRLLSYLGLIDIQTYLEGDIMCKVDRATMQHALEGREPFLDHHIIEFSQRLPDYLKIRGNCTKYILRKILYKHVPKELIERPKQGFTPPFKKWLLTILSDQVKAIPQDKDFLETFQLNEKNVQKTISNFMEQRGYVNPYLVWFFYSLHSWYNRWLK